MSDGVAVFMGKHLLPQRLLHTLNANPTAIELSCLLLQPCVITIALDIASLWTCFAAGRMPLSTVDSPQASRHAMCPMEPHTRSARCCHHSVRLLDCTGVAVAVHKSQLLSKPMLAADLLSCGLTFLCAMQLTATYSKTSSWNIGVQLGASRPLAPVLAAQILMHWAWLTQTTKFQL